MISLNRYLKTRETATAQQPLFLSKRNQRIDSGSVWHLVKKYLKQAQIEKDVVYARAGGDSPAGERSPLVGFRCVVVP